MPTSRPPIYDDGGDLPDVARRAADSPGRTPSQGPNYLVRRAIVVGVVVVAVAAAAIVAGRLLGDDGDGSGGGIGDAKWNTVVGIDRNVGTVVLTDDQGEETNRFRLGIAALTDSTVVNKTLIGVTNSAVALVELDRTAEIATTDVTTIDIDSAGALVRPSGTTNTVLVPDATNQRVVMVHGPSGEVIDTASIDAVSGARYDVQLARAEPAGRHVLLTDAGNFQSVLFSFDRDTPSFFPGLALAVDDSIVVTAQNVGTNANVAVFDHDGEPGVAAQTASVRAGMIGDGEVVLIGVDGSIQTLSLGGGEIADVATLSVGTIESGHVALRGDRLVVTGSEGTAVVDASGAVIAEFAAARPTTSGVDDVAPRRSTCLILERSAAGEVAVTDLEDGSVRVEALASPEVLAPVDGCEPVVPTSAGYLALTADGVIPATLTGDVVELSPDGGTIAFEEANRLLLLPRVSSGDEESEVEPIDVGRAGRTVSFAEL